MEDSRRLTQRAGRKIGILGGTFNPVHVGHLLLAENAYSLCGLDEVRFIPSGVSYMKDPAEIADASHRLAMLSLAVRDNPHFSVSTIELERSGNTYTCETLSQLKEQEPDAIFYFLIGADILFTMEKWRCPEQIFKQAVILALVRDDCDTAALKKQAALLKERFSAMVELIPAGSIQISSSEIRRRIREGLSVRYMLPEPVRQYIGEHGLYR